MSTSSNRSSLMPDRRRGANLGDGRTRARATSRARATNVTYDEAYTYALRVAFLHHLLQPKRKRKEYVAAPRPPVRAHTSSVGDLMKEFLPRDSTTSADIRLPRGFRTALEARMEGVLRGTEKLPGYNDAAVKRSFAEAYTAFTDSSFRKTIDKERKIEPMALIFYSSATKALQRGRAPDDDSWKLLVDRHLALFLRLATSTLRDQGSDKPELVNRLTTLENKLLVNDQNLYIDSSQDAGGATVEVVVPLSYDVKDMPMVQDVARIFGLTLAQVQAHLDNNRQIWTEEAALKDLKSYQHRLNTNLPGALRSQDFDIEDAFEEWKKSEAPHLSHMMMEILIAKPELAATSSHGLDKALPAGPPSTYGEDQAYSELSRVLASGSVDPGAMFGYDPALNFGALSISDNSSIKLVDEVNYTFIPPDPRAYYKAIVKYAMDFDHMHGDPSAAYAPLSKASTELLTEICVRWRIPQVTRLVAFLEVASKKFLDREIEPTELDVCIELVQDPQPEPKKAPAIHMHTANVSQIPVSRWTLQDIAGYRQCLYSVHDALLRDLYGMLLKCYEPKPPSIGVVMHILEAHIYSDPSFSRKEEDAAAYAELLRDGLRNEATEVYRHYLDEEIPRSQEDWDFGHVVKLGQSVVKLCDRIRKRYSKNPEIMGVNPLTILVETMFPNFEKDAEDIIKRVVDVAKSKGTEIDLQDGFDLYRELVQIRRIHLSSLPAQPFAFDIENALVDFVWRWIRNAEEKMENFVDEAIKQDQFQVRTHRPDDIPTDEQRHSVSVMDIFQLFNQTANQIFDLNWDNDIHHAKFMTSLARTFAAGIGRYCEVVEQRFAKEMDRPTAEELAAAQKTTQEKFFQYAKDAWNTKEKVQPFQFYPESFVKLNNIEFAMQELDKLSKTMNVDACAEVLRKNEPPTAKTRKPTKYVFTVKIVEAEDLKACDPNGTSDPYVVLCDEYGKRLAKTRIIMRNLNPRWDESIDITVQGPLNLVATIWDYDTFGDHDFVGRTTLKLDPNHFSDYLPREFWLDLDTQGRLMIRVSMEGERDDIQFWFGKAFRHLKRTERDMVRKITDKLTQHINASLSREALNSLLNKGIAASMANMWRKKGTAPPQITPEEIASTLQSLFSYFDENFAIMKQTLTDATMLAVMTRLWKEVLMAIENLLVPPLSEKPSQQKPLTQRELDVVYKWLELLFDFFHAKDPDTGEVLGVPADVLKSPKYHELASLNFFYFDTTDNLIRTSERMAAATAQRAQQQMHGGIGGGPGGPASLAGSRLSAPPSFGGAAGLGSAFASMGTIRRGKSIMMSRNLGTMRRAKEEKRREAQADPSDDMILRILRMRPEAAGYLRERHRQKERMAAAQAAAVIVRQSVYAGFPGVGGGAGFPPPFSGPQFGKNNLPRR